MEDLPKWKAKTQYALEGSGHHGVLSSDEYAQRNTRTNRVVFSQLSVATVDVIAHHLIEKHETTRDGHAASNSLCKWYDGDAVKNENAERLRVRLGDLRLRPGFLHQFTSTSFYPSTMSYSKYQERVFHKVIQFTYFLEILNVQLIKLARNS